MIDRGGQRVALALVLAAVAAGCGSGHSISSAGVGGNGGGSSSAGGNGGAFACTLPPLSADLTRTWDVQVATVSGKITMAGAAVPDSPSLQTRGQILFTRDGIINGTVDLGATGPVSFSIPLFAGVYDIDLQTTPFGGLVGLPLAAGTRLASAVHIAGNPQLDYDLTVLPVAGTVTIDGATMPDSPGAQSRGTIDLIDRVSGVGTPISIANTGPGSFSGAVFAGTYDVVLRASPDAAIVGLPKSGATLLGKGVEIRTTGTSLSYDIHVASVSGVVTLNGGALPNESGAIVLFQDSQTHASAAFAINNSASSAGAYGGMLFAGTYDVTFRSTTSSPSLLPRSHYMPLASGVAVSGTVTANYDLPYFAVSGTVTNGGGPLPATAASAFPAQISFVSRRDGSTTACLILPSSGGTFSCSVFGGTYDVDFVTAYDSGHLDALFTSGTTTRVARDVLIGGPATLSYDLSVVPVSGTVTSGGAELPDGSIGAHRGQVVLRSRASGASRYLSLVDSGPATFSGDVFAGTYDALFSTARSPDPAGLEGVASLASAVVIGPTSAITFAWDAPMISVGGTVTLGGAVLPDVPGVLTRGNVIFHDKLTGSAYPLALAATGPGTISGKIFVGSYDVELAPLPTTPPLVGLPSAGTDLETGCLAPFTCTAGVATDDVSGNWTLVFRERGYWQDWAALLNQAGSGGITGGIQSLTSYRGIMQGARTGNALQMSSFLNSVYELDATLESACVMTGRGVNTSQQNPNSFPAASPFMGFR